METAESEVIEEDILALEPIDLPGWAELVAKVKGAFGARVYDMTNPDEEKEARSVQRRIGSVCSRLEEAAKTLKGPLQKQIDDINTKKNNFEKELRVVQAGIKSQIEARELELQKIKHEAESFIKITISMGEEFRGLSLDQLREKRKELAERKPYEGFPVDMIDDFNIALNKALIKNEEAINQAVQIEEAAEIKRKADEERAALEKEKRELEEAKRKLEAEKAEHEASKVASQVSAEEQKTADLEPSANQGEGVIPGLGTGSSENVSGGLEVDSAWIDESDNIPDDLDITPTPVPKSKSQVVDNSADIHRMQVEVNILNYFLEVLPGVNGDDAANLLQDIKEGKVPGLTISYE